jgi:hypothetical protein
MLLAPDAWCRIAGRICDPAGTEEYMVLAYGEFCNAGEYSNPVRKFQRYWMGDFMLVFLKR